MGDGLISSDDLEDQFNVGSDVHFSELFQPVKDTSLVKEELNYILEDLKVNLNKARGNLKKIEEVTDLVDSQICEPSKKRIRNPIEAA